MTEKEQQYLEKNILKLIQESKSVKIENILEYLDYVNKVSYSEKDIKPIIERLIKKKQIKLFNNEYSFIKSDGKN